MIFWWPMTIGYIGLGKMGKNMVLHLLEQGEQVVAYNRSPEPVAEVVTTGATGATSIEDLVTRTRELSTLDSQPSTIVWLMLPAGQVTDEHIDQLVPLLQSGDLVIDGANSNYKDTLRRAEKLQAKGIRFMDVAVSGGPSGARTGACLFIGGEEKDFHEVKNLIEHIAAPTAYQYCGSIGSGHFAKMVHNGIEYGMMQAIAEGAAVLEKSPFHFDLAKIFTLYNNKSVIESRLVGWAQQAFTDNPTLTGISSTIAHSGEGEWTIDAAKEFGVSVPIIEESLTVRKQSANEPENFRNKVVTALRGQFGGHSTK